MTASSALRCLSSSAGASGFAARLAVGDWRGADPGRGVFGRAAGFGLRAALRFFAAESRFAALRLFAILVFLVFAVVSIACPLAAFSAAPELVAASCPAAASQWEVELPSRAAVGC
jgi:hypothetical protein